MHCSTLELQVSNGVILLLERAIKSTQHISQYRFLQYGKVLGYMASVWAAYITANACCKPLSFSGYYYYCVPAFHITQ